MFSLEDDNWMQKALKLAEEAAESGEVPIGAVIVLDGKQIAAAKNRMEELQSAAAHAEILAINEACQTIKNWRLDGATLYVSLEPCQMCWGAIRNSRISKVVFGAKAELPRASNEQLLIEGGLFEKESAQILQKFFRKVRKIKNDSGVKE
ncbi:MAG: nucleoside deaminase [Fibromonadaceae bacterium]|jgi:tRNA(adenine34) deaminase|nr:nucleoside deaminase [Fibromonadaceae bacterium]